MKKWLDVSHWQGTIDFNKLITDHDLDGVIIKATDGSTKRDPNFEVNVKGARSVGLKVGAYHFYRPTQPPEDQADNFITTMKLVGGPIMPVLDLEPISNGTTPEDWETPSAELRDTVVKEFCSILIAKLTIAVVIYTTRFFIHAFLPNSSWLSTHQLFVADYSNDPPHLPVHWTTWGFWQKSERSTEPGIQGNVDLDEFNDEIVEISAIMANP